MGFDAMEKIIADSSFLIALARKADENHVRSVAIKDSLDNNTFLITDHILGEIVTFLNKRDSAQIAHAVGKTLLQSSDMTIIFPEESELEQALDYLRKYNVLSFCDALSITLMKSNGISKIVSFDSDFDKIAGVERIF